MINETRGSEPGLTFIISESNFGGCTDRVLKICNFEPVPLDSWVLDRLKDALQQADRFPVSHKITITYPKPVNFDDVRKKQR
jgi:hypothetical protein